MIQRAKSLIGGILVLGALGLHAAVIALFHFRWDSLALATVFPVWLYTIAALGMLVIARFFIRTRWIPAIALVWLLTLPFLADETSGLKNLGMAYRPEPEVQPDTISPHALRMVTLNCRRRSLEPLDEIAEWKPDIVFLQEAPFIGNLRAFGKKLYGKNAVVVRGRESAIIARGKQLRTIPLTGPAGIGRPRGVVAQLELLDGRFINLVNVHLDSATTELTVWRPDTWRHHANNRRRRRESLRFILSHFNQLPAAPQAFTPAIVAGDFNSPAGDAATRALHSNFIDAFTMVGVGWGNTFPAGLPVHRIDQVWLDKRLDGLGLTTELMKVTDHRMVVCDFIFRP